MSYIALLLTYILICISLAMAVHVLSCRVKHDDPHYSPQAAISKIILLGNVPLLTGIIIIDNLNQATLNEYLINTLYGFIVYNGILYAYFHLFNMSETARRIRILLQIKSQGSLSSKDLENLYSAEDMVTARLKRLKQMNAVNYNSQENTYTINNKHPLLKIARTFYGLRRLLGFLS